MYHTKQSIHTLFLRCNDSCLAFSLLGHYLIIVSKERTRKMIHTDGEKKHSKVEINAKLF